MHRDARHLLLAININVSMRLCSCILIRQPFRMTMKILLITLFVLSVCSCIHSHKAHLPGKSRPCCMNVSRANVSSLITGNQYYEQPAGKSCVKAVIFNTKDGLVCVHPDAPWVPNVIARLGKA